MEEYGMIRADSKQKQAMDRKQRIYLDRPYHSIRTQS